MRLAWERVTRASRWHDSVKRLYEQAFPAYERYPLWTLRVISCLNGAVTLRAYYDSQALTPDVIGAKAAVGASSSQVVVADAATEASSPAADADTAGAGASDSDAAAIEAGASDLSRVDAFCGMAYCAHSEQLLYVGYLAVDGQRRSQGCGSAILSQLRDENPGRHLVLEVEPMDPSAHNYKQRARRLAFYERNGFRPAGLRKREGGQEYSVLWKPSRPNAIFPQDEFLRLSKSAFAGLARVSVFPEPAEGCVGVASLQGSCGGEGTR